MTKPLPKTLLNLGCCGELNLCKWIPNSLSLYLLLVVLWLINTGFHKDNTRNLKRVREKGGRRGWESGCQGPAIVFHYSWDAEHLYSVVTFSLLSVNDFFIFKTGRQWLRYWSIHLFTVKKGDFIYMTWIGAKLPEIVAVRGASFEFIWIHRIDLRICVKNVILTLSCIQRKCLR